MCVRYSIIVPHYNDMERVERLLSSIPLAREDIEVIVVDDCSSNGGILDSAKEIWPTVTWLTTSKNSGAGVARNMGINFAKGRWLLFADSDDEFFPEAFETFDRVLQDGDQLVYFLAVGVHEVDGTPSVRSDRMNELVLDYISSNRVSAFQRLRLGHVVPWAKVYSRDFIEAHHIRFDPVRASNDVAFNVLAAMQASVMRAEAIPVYRIYHRAGSLTTESSAKDLLERLEVLCNLNQRLCALGKKERMHAASYLAQSINFGPGTWMRVILLILRGKMFAATLRRLGLNEVLQFLRRSKKHRAERQLLLDHESLSKFPEEVKLGRRRKP